MTHRAFLNLRFHEDNGEIGYEQIYPHLDWEMGVIYGRVKQNKKFLVKTINDILRIWYNLSTSPHQ